MKPYHATGISLVSRACPFALELQERGVPADRSVYQVGIAAHAVMEGVSLCTNECNRELTPEEVNCAALGVCERLMSVGRSYDGKGEPAMSPESVFAGQEVALAWLAWNPIQPGGQVELGLGLDDNPDMETLIAKQGYRGSRYSFGYPACPDLEQQVMLCDLLHPERIGVELSEEFQLHPEQSTSAIIVHHPEAKYFNAG